jgi:protein-S-isoprenylcysteine O-methyltransferase Ste14
MIERVFVWIGGACFAGALAFCTWWYLFVLGRGAPFTGVLSVAVDAALFTIFALHHSVFARDIVKRSVAAVFPDRLLRSLYVWTASALLMLVCLLWQPVGGVVYDVRGVAAILFVAVEALGVWMIVQSVQAIDPLELAGIHPPRPTDALQIRGPYGIVRHPLYLGWILAVFGHPHLTGDRAAFAAISSIYLLAAIPWEERSLTAAFGDGYRRYQQQVRWRVIPFVY